MLKQILQGMVVGIANIIPGVSGGTMMVAMGLYDHLIHAITHLKSEFKKSMKLLIPIFLGVQPLHSFLCELLLPAQLQYPEQKILSHRVLLPLQAPLLFSFSYYSFSPSMYPSLSPALIIRTHGYSYFYNNPFNLFLSTLFNISTCF